MQENYGLGVDFGSAFIHAAIARPTEHDDVVVCDVALGAGSDAFAACAFVAPNGAFLLGNDAVRAGAVQPHLLVSDVARTVGSDVPLLVRGRAIAAESLMAQLVAEVVAKVTQTEGCGPAHVALTVPATWGAHRISALTAALDVTELPPITIVSAPIAAATDHAARTPESPREQHWAIVALGASDLTCTIVAQPPTGSAVIVQPPRHVADVGGDALDDAVMRHVLAYLTPEALAAADPSRLRELRADCTRAKEELSTRPQTVVSVLDLGTPSTVRITRAELESLIDPLVDRGVAACLDAIDSDGTRVDEVILVGAASQVPRVSQKLSEASDRPVTLADAPAGAQARGAARIALDAARDAAAEVPVTVEVAPIPRAPRRAILPTRLRTVRRWAAVGVLGGLVVATLTASSLASSDAVGAPPSGPLPFSVFDTPKIVAALFTPPGATPTPNATPSTPGSPVPTAGDVSSATPAPLASSGAQTTQTTAGAPSTGTTPTPSAVSPSSTTTDSPPAPEPSTTTADPPPPPEPSTAGPGSEPPPSEPGQPPATSSAAPEDLTDATTGTTP